PLAAGRARLAGIGALLRRRGRVRAGRRRQARSRQLPTRAGAARGAPRGGAVRRQSGGERAGGARRRPRRGAAGPRSARGGTRRRGEQPGLRCRADAWPTGRGDDAMTESPGGHQLGAPLPYMCWLRTFVGSAPLIMTFTAACIRDEQGRVLQMRRGGEASELWGFPGGAMELGESIAEAAAREAREEVGLEVAPERLIGVYSAPEFGFSYANGDQVQVVILFLECRVVGG